MFGVYSAGHQSGASLRADLQKVTGEEDDLSAANQSKQPQALSSRDFLRIGSSCLLQAANSFGCSGLRACSVLTGEISQGS